MIYSRIRIGIILLLGLVSAAPAQRQMENLTRGIVAVKQADGSVYVAWRLFGTDPETVVFNLYRISGSGEAVKAGNSRF
jgi:rhamnogalacturonan endolyase